MAIQMHSQALFVVVVAIVEQGANCQQPRDVIFITVN
jgi:hypothetical protein